MPTVYEVYHHIDGDRIAACVIIILSFSKFKNADLLALTPIDLLQLPTTYPGTVAQGVASSVLATKADP